MRVFLSFSGIPSLSHDVAKALEVWLPNVLPTVEPWISDDNISKGKASIKELVSALESSSCGIFCLTCENLQSPWITFEAGVLSKNETFRVCPLLINISSKDVHDHPLAQFQPSTIKKGDMLKLIMSINDTDGLQAVEKSTLVKNFNNSWPRLEKEIIGFTKNPKYPPSITRIFNLCSDYGTMINPADDSRNVAFKVDTINNIFASLGDELKKSSDLVKARQSFFTTGYHAGREFGKRIRTKWTNEFPTETILDFVNRWCHFDSNAGWGRLVNKLKLNKGIGQISGTLCLCNNFQTFNRSVGDFPDCALMYGYIKGVLESLCAGVPISVECKRDQCPLLNTLWKECIFEVTAIESGKSIK